MKKNLLNIILGTSITALGAGCAVRSETEENDIHKDQGSIVDLPVIDLDGSYHSSNEDSVSDAPAAGSDNEVNSVSPDEENNLLKKVYAAAATKFAQCLVDQGVQFYGAWWCAPCQIQKYIFGAGWPIIEKENYIECADPGKEGFSQECTNKEIYSLPQAHFEEVKVSGWLFLHQFEEKFSTLPCHYDGPKIPSENDLDKYLKIKIVGPPPKHLSYKFYN